ncbi:hypothetical protein [Flavobacterium sp. GSB-24]|uniref:hypothetical protein n=1 Tax=Flavobacterium sp. GSB-24 TaxID=2994319 RepID=UPI00249062B1|nr:hypothetical protein [Flavobacterium sp. GSB-24]BDU25165.1 hypothetical protein FLGSB24_19090 [Flavobacterium sp. GSB-24]
MTLVIAKIIEDDIQIISDTKITDIFLGSQNPLKGQLKTVILNPYISISFSGLPDYAEEVLQSYYKKELLNLNSLLIKCLEINRKSHDKTNFIVCTINRNQPKIYKVTNYQIEQNLKNAWIGDKIGFSKYQEYYHNSSKSQDFEKMENAFEKVIDDEKVETVGDFMVRVTNEADASATVNYLNYQINRICYVGPYEFVNTEPDKFMIKNASSEKGGFGISFLRSFDPQTPAFGIHFHVGNFGLLFFPKCNYSNGIVFQNQTDGEKFAEEIKRQFGFDVQGLLISEDGLSYKNINTSKT